MSKAAPVEKDPHHAEQMPRGVLFGAAALLAFVLVFTLLGRSKDVGGVNMPAAQPYQTLLLRFTDETDGGITITDASNGAVLQKIPPETNGFLRSAVRGLANARSLAGLGPEAPFRLVRWSTGAMSLIDDKTGRRIDVDAFGSNQAQLFVRLLKSSKPAAP